MSYYNRFLPQISAKKKSLTILNTDYIAQTSSGSSHTWNSVNIGLAQPNRYIVVVYSTHRDVGANISSVTFNGNAMTPITDNLQSGLLRVRAFIIAAPTGDTATIVGTYSNSTANTSISVFALYGLNSTTPISEDFDSTVSSLALQTSIDVQSGGGSIHVAGTTTNNRTFTWTGTAGEVKVYENSSTASNYAVSVAIAEHNTTTTGLTAIATANNTIANPWLLSLSFR